jgi:ribosomal protein L19E
MQVGGHYPLVASEGTAAAVIRARCRRAVRALASDRHLEVDIKPRRGYAQAPARRSRRQRAEERRGGSVARRNSRDAIMPPNCFSTVTPVSRSGADDRIGGIGSHVLL